MISKELQEAFNNIIARGADDWREQAYELEEQERERLEDERAQADAIDLKIDDFKLNRR